jgi:NAD+ diphosphatase
MPERPLVPVLSRTAHDRDAVHRHDAAWLAEVWPSAQVLVLSDRGTTPAVTDDGTAKLRLRPAADVDIDADVPRSYLGQADGITYFSVPADPPADPPSDQPADAGDGPESWLGLRELGGQLDDLGAGLLTAAVGLSNWHATHTHCPRCGALTEVVDAGWSRRCPVDASTHFPRTDPAVIMLVHDGGDRCVLGRQASWAGARYSILAGFVESGESAEAAVVREVYEEVGLQVKDVSYVSSQPWPFPASLMLGFTALAVGDLTIERRDDELADAGWFTRAEVRAAATWESDPTRADDAVPPGTRLGALPGGISIARHLLEDWLAET